MNRPRWRSLATVLCVVGLAACLLGYVADLRVYHFGKGVAPEGGWGWTAIVRSGSLAFIQRQAPRGADWSGLGYRLHLPRYASADVPAALWGFHVWTRVPPPGGVVPPPTRPVSLVTVVVPLWPAVLVLAILPARALWAWRRDRPGRRPGLCPACGYDVRATPGRCPECGAGRV